MTFREKIKGSYLKFIFIMCILALYTQTGNKVMAKDFEASRRDISEIIEESSVSSNAIDENNLEVQREIALDGISWEINDDVLYIKRIGNEKRNILFEKYSDCPWNEYSYKTVRVDAKVGVKLWYFDKGKARKCGRI